ncbi:hypothetical protein [Amycolatopsis sp. cmx-4-68]|uniref:hypothetical protein n=1 Tax=Amycolatopsis sp. cmx-4-68 TaxID=2790938 RepID=UPI00397E74E6
MDGYAVKVDELGKLIDDLGTAADRMADANKKLGGGGAFGSLGQADLGKAGEEFEEAWGYGIGRLGDAASEITERLKQAKQKYEQIEAQFGAELGKFGSAVFGDGPDGPGETGGAKGNHPGLDRPDGGPVGGGYTGGVPGIDGLAERTDPGADLGDGGMVGGGITGGMPGIGGLAERTDPGADLGDGGMVGGGVTGGVPGIGGLAGQGDPGGVPGINDQAQGDDRPVGGGATGGITDLLNGLDR